MLGGGEWCWGAGAFGLLLIRQPQVLTGMESL
jgi:hypothetical protein